LTTPPINRNNHSPAPWTGFAGTLDPHAAECWTGFTPESWTGFAGIRKLSVFVRNHSSNEFCIHAVGLAALPDGLGIVAGILGI
jgi:hypothetical protein